jgi:cysteine desulfurase
MAAACAKALETAVVSLDERQRYVSQLNGYLRSYFSGNSRFRVNSPEGAVPHILNVSAEGIKGEEMRRRLDERGVCVSVKSACSVANTPSRAVYAITHDRKNALSSWRISLSHLTTMEELQRFTEILDEIVK